MRALNIYSRDCHQREIGFKKKKSLTQPSRHRVFHYLLNQSCLFKIFIIKGFTVNGLNLGVSIDVCESVHDRVGQCSLEKDCWW